MANIDVLKLPEYLNHQRWFGGKGIPIKQASVLDQVVLTSARPREGTEFVLAVVDVIYELGTPQRYLLVVRVDQDGQVSDALLDDELAHRLFRIILERESLPTSGGVIRGEQKPVAAPFLEPVRSLGPIRRLEGEQSNTPLRFHVRGILQVIRKLF